MMLLIAWPVGYVFLIEDPSLSFRCSELSVASVDIGLTTTVARNVAKTVQLYTAKCEQLVRHLLLLMINRKEFVLFSCGVEQFQKHCQGDSRFVHTKSVPGAFKNTCVTAEAGVNDSCIMICVCSY